MSLPRYAEYKDSGFEWLGDIPAHWAIRKFRHSFRESSEKIEGDVLSPMLSVSGYRGIEVKKYDDENRRRTDEELVGYRIVHPGQLVVNTMWLNYAGLGVSAHEGHVSPAYRAYWIADDLNPQFVHHMMRSGEFVKGYTKFLTGIRPNSLQMSREDLMEFRLAEPPLVEQSAIAAFLDRETGKIDALIAEQEKLLTLLAEKRQATISHAVTRGLNPKAQMKDSGVPWLGEVPAHWDVVRIKDVARLESGHTPSKQVPEFWENCDIPWVSLNDSKQLAVVDYISETAVQINAAGLENSSARMLPPGTVVFTRDATIGLAAITTKAMAVSQHLIAWCPSPLIDGVYLLRVFNFLKPHLDSLTFGATIKTIGMGEVKRLVTPLPPPEEQQEIAQYISAETGKLDKLRHCAQRAVDLLKERRSALISAAVTGKIDVRGPVHIQTEPKAHEETE